MEPEYEICLPPAMVSVPSETVVSLQNFGSATLVSLLSWASDTVVVPSRLMKGRLFHVQVGLAGSSEVAVGA
jgi:hypothetical protein